MYCKRCGYRSDEKIDLCSKCGSKLADEGPLSLERPAAKKLHWGVFAVTAVIAVIAFFVVPRFFLTTDLETVGPTDKLKFLRAMEHSAYQRAGQGDIHVDMQTLVVTWDLRWNTLPENKQKEILRIIGHAWQVVGGKDMRLQIEGEDTAAAAYP